jgi:catechol 2,3-dioxygenase-like lactoylglutathione lyase family enzyme
MATFIGSSHVLAVHDLERSRRYYQDVLGFEVDLQPDGWLFLRRDRCHLMLGECPDSLPATDLGDHSYFAYVEVDDIDTLYERVDSTGGEVLGEPQDKPWGMREFGVRTVDGHRILFGQSLD